MFCELEAGRVIALRPPWGKQGPPVPVFRLSANVCAATRRWRAKERPVVLTIIDLLPAELMEMILLMLFTTWPRATCVLRVSVAFAAVATRVLERDVIGEWWTGSGQPLTAPAGLEEPNVNLLRNTRALAALCVPGASLHDVDSILLQASLCLA